MGGPLPGRRRPTLEDVARAAGVSRATASRVLRGEGRFSDDSRDAVLAAASSLGYVPNVLASDLASKDAHPSVGLLLRDATNPAYGLLFGCLQDEARAAGLTMVTMTVVGDPDNSVQMDTIRRLLGLRVRALVVATGSVPSEEIVPFRRDVWIVRTGRPEPEGLLDAVSYDEQAHGRMLAEHVWQLGHRRVVVQAVARTASLPEHLRGEAMVARLAGLGAVVDRVEVGDLAGPAAAVVAVDRALAGGATCVMNPSDLRLLDVVRELSSRGLVAGRDLSASGCDGILPGCDVMGLTTVRIPVEDVARTTVARLVEALARDDAALPAAPVQTALAGRLVAGRTVGPAR